MRALGGIDSWWCRSNVDINLFVASIAVTEIRFLSVCREAHIPFPDFDSVEKLESVLVALLGC